MQPTPFLPTDDPAIPPFLQQRPVNPTTTLTYIQTQISAIYTTAKTSNNNNQIPYLSHDTYSKIYTAVFDYLTKSKESAWVLGGVIYRFLHSEIQNYCKHIRNNIFGTGNGDTDITTARKRLGLYMSSYRIFAKVSSLVRGLVRVWDRHWMRREYGLRKIRVASVEDLHKAIWKEEVLGVDVEGMSEKNGVEELTDAVAILRATEGGMTDYDSVLLRNIAKGLSGLGVTLES
jgi:hypothetical protein